MLNYFLFYPIHRSTISGHMTAFHILL